MVQIITSETCQECAKTSALRVLSYFGLFNLNQSNTRFFCDPHCINSLYGPRRIEPSINWYVWFNSRMVYNLRELTHT